MLIRIKDLKIGDVFIQNGIKFSVVDITDTEIIFFPFNRTYNVKNDCCHHTRRTFGRNCQAKVEQLIDR